MTLAALVILSQLADGLAYVLARTHGTELVPTSAVILAAFGPGAMLAVKLAAGLVLGVGAFALRRRRSLVASMAMVGLVGALSEVVALL